MAGIEAAQAKMAQAEAKLKSGGGMMRFFTGGPNYEEASDLFQQAANQFKLAKQWQDVAECFQRCAYCAQKSQNATDEANHLMEAGNAMKKVSTAEAVPLYERAIGIYNANGRFSNSAKLLLAIAEAYEAESVRKKEALEYYKRAAEMYEMDDFGKSNLSKCNLKVAEIAAKEGDLQEAIRLFEQEGEKSLSSNLLQYGAKEQFLKAGILHLASGDSVTAKIAVERYNGLDPRFEGSREGKLLADLVQAFEAQDVDDFTDKLSEYDHMTKLTPWQTEFLVKVKDMMSPSSAEGFENEVDLT